MRKFTNSQKVTTFQLLIQIILIGLISFALNCEKLTDSEPTGKCVYGPSAYQTCVDGTYKDECENNFNGTWSEGQECDK